ncbi:MFS transporter [Nesterenkonia sandarakina]|uniref:MFS family permease n=1 Tax=Nesterenkonia sandarakina TaxID=272918 RepID=A0A7Z0J2Y3_9MICC|nr:MFS transporter [Nesterenkonia sandarakina]NYJ16193.1 MFS family permease [Nesterenkonia sandarakina]
MSQTPPPQTNPAPHFGRLIYPLALSVGVSFGAILFGTSVLITSTAAGAEFSVALLSTAFSGSVLTGAIFAVPVGRYGDRHGIRGITALGGTLVALGFIGFALSQTPWQVLGCWWALIGPGSAMVLFEPAFIGIQQWFDRTARNKAAGTLTLITGLAGPIFIPTTTYLAEELGWRATAIVLGAVVLVVSLAVAGWSLRVHPPAPSAGGEEAITPRKSKSLKRFPTGFIPLTLGVLLTMAVLEAFNVHRIARFEDSGFDPTMVAWWAAAVGLLSLPARFLLPVLANRFDPAKLWLISTALIMPSVWMAVRGTEAWELHGHFIIFGLLFGAFMPLRAVIMSDWFTGPRFGALMGVQAVAIAVGRAGGPALVGWMAGSHLGYSTAMFLLSLILLGSAVMVAVAIARRSPNH